MEYRQLFVAPVNLREKMTALIDREIEHQRAGRGGHIVVKINRLADNQVIEKLYEASAAVIELIVRGVCMLRPGVPGLSENITVRNIIGRFLEHSRVFYFANAGDADVYIGSPDWMGRNLKHRIEVVTPITNPAMKTYLKDVLLAAYLRDNVRARELQLDGSYAQIPRVPDEELFDSQEFFIENDSVLLTGVTQ